MNGAPTLAPVPPQAVRPGTPAGPASRRRYRLAILRRILATWGERLRIRRELAQKLRDSPYLIDDMGLTRRQAEAEIAKPFWRP